MSREVINLEFMNKEVNVNENDIYYEVNIPIESLFKSIINNKVKDENRSKAFGVGEILFISNKIDKSYLFKKNGYILILNNLYDKPDNRGYRIRRLRP